MRLGHEDEVLGLRLWPHEKQRNMVETLSQTLKITRLTFFREETR